MPCVSNKIISDITEHIRKFGGDFTTWCVATSSDWHNPALDPHKTEEDHADLPRSLFTRQRFRRNRE